MSFVMNLARGGLRRARALRSRLRGDDPRFFPDGFPIDAWADPHYEAWFKAHRATERDLADQRARALDFSYTPQFSFIVPLYKTPLDYLRVMASSVLEQTYPNLQLVLVNASPEIRELHDEVEKLAQADERVTVLTLEDGNRGITENTNAGLEVATGEFCCFFDHDDALEPDLLFEYVSALNDDPQIDVLYCDEDLVEAAEGASEFSHLHPLFKPELSPELLLCKNYVVHLMTVRRSLIDEMPRPDKRYDGAQDYNMILFCSNRARRVHHVPKVLYHWRISATSTAANPQAKPYSRKAYRLAAFGELERRVPEGRIVASGAVNIHNIWMASHAGDGPVSVIMRSSGDARLLERTLECFCQVNTCGEVELIVVGPRDEDIARICAAFGVRFRLADGPEAGIDALNAAAAESYGEMLLFIDDLSMFCTAEPVEQLVRLCHIDGVGISSPKLLYNDGRNKAFGVAVTSERVMPLYRGYPDDFPGYQCNLKAFQNVSAVPMQGLCTRRRLFDELGGFDARFGEELAAVDYCKRVRDAGHRLVVTPTVKLEIDEASPEHPFDCAENAADYPAEDVARFDEKWPGARAAGDPCFSANLDQSSSYLQLPRL